MALYRCTVVQGAASIRYFPFQISRLASIGNFSQY
jgi:hypothetical protein